MNIKIIKYIKDLLLLILPLILGLTIGYFYKPNDKFLVLRKPSFMPPSYLFSITWTILYILIGISMYYALRKKSFVYWIIPILHLIVNLLFSPVMFGLNDIFGGFIITLLTLIFTIIMIIQFYYSKSYFSIYILLPYICWLIFATILAYKTYELNK